METVARKVAKLCHLPRRRNQNLESGIMGVLRNPQLERFALALLSNIAAGMPRSKAAHEAALTAGYKGKSVASNARKMAQRKDVKARLRELAAPIVEREREKIEATVEWATERLCSIAGPNLGDDALAVGDQINAMKLLAQIHGWLAPKKRTHDVSDTLAQVLMEVDGRTRGLPTSV